MIPIVKACDIAGQNRILLMGDFNLKEINWIEDEAIGSHVALPFMFKECMKDCFLYQHVLEPTRFRDEQESTLDLVFTKEEEDVKNIKIDNPLGKSDHAMVVGDLICEWRANSIFKSSRLYHKANFEEINKLISEVN